jgi:hypothetical protein
MWEGIQMLQEGRCFCTSSYVTRRAGFCCASLLYRDRPSDYVPVCIHRAHYSLPINNTFVCIHRLHYSLPISKWIHNYSVMLVRQGHRKRKLVKTVTCLTCIQTDVFRVFLRPFKASSEIVPSNKDGFFRSPLQMNHSLIIISFNSMQTIHSW